MARYIDADPLYVLVDKVHEIALNKLLDTPKTLSDGELNPMYIRNLTLVVERAHFKEEIFDAPTADVRENVRAHWDRVEMKKGEWWHTCSKCKATWGSEDGELDFNFCPNCGARMEANDAEVH